MEAFEYDVLRERACNSPDTLIQPSIKDMQPWVTGLNRRRSLHLPAVGEPLDHFGISFRELEQRYHLQDVWGYNTTPAMQTLECIQKVKEALAEDATEDTISSGFFLVLVGVSVLAAVTIVLIWELYVRPHTHGLTS